MFAKRWTLSALTLSAALMLSACGGQSGTSSSAPAQDNGSMKEYVVGLDATYAPLEYEENGQVVGFSPDILHAIAENQGIKLRLVNTPWEGIFTTLESGDRDVLSSSITMTPERRQSMDFSDPYFEATQMIAVNQTETGINSFNDLKDRMVSVQSGTTGDLTMQKLQGEQSRNIKRFDVMPLALKELLNGGVHASVGDNAVMQNFVNNNPDAKLRTFIDDTAFEKEFYGFAVSKGRDDDLLAKLNAGLAAIKADGTYDRIYNKWFSAGGADEAASSASQ